MKSIKLFLCALFISIFSLSVQAEGLASTKDYLYIGTDKGLIVKKSGEGQEFFQLVPLSDQVKIVGISAKPYNDLNENPTWGGKETFIIYVYTSTGNLFAFLESHVVIGEKISKEYLKHMPIPNQFK